MLCVRSQIDRTRQRVVVKHVQTLPASADSQVWQQVARVEIKTTPLWWRDDVEPKLSVQTLHDGTAICFRMSWADSHPSQDSTRSEDFEDAIRSKSLSRVSQVR